jgi:hypothetical protein
MFICFPFLYVSFGVFISFILNWGFARFSFCSVDIAIFLFIFVFVFVDCCKVSISFWLEMYCVSFGVNWYVTVFFVFVWGRL